MGKIPELSVTVCAIFIAVVVMMIEAGNKMSIVIGSDISCVKR